MRRREIRYLGPRSHQSEARDALREPGDLALVERGAPRSVVLRCPDGCGETLTVNLDRRVAKAWRFFARDGEISIYPSVWRTTGCRSHFIVWNNGIYWNDGRDEPRPRWDQQRLGRQVLARLARDHFTSVEAVAGDLDEVPWLVAGACRLLARDGLVVEGDGELEDHYRLSD